MVIKHIVENQGVFWPGKAVKGTWNGTLWIL